MEDSQRFALLLTTAERDKRLAEAIDYYNSHNRSIPVRKVAAKFKVSYTTLNNQIHGKHRSIASNGGLNILLAVRNSCPPGTWVWVPNFIKEVCFILIYKHLVECKSQ